MHSPHMCKKMEGVKLESPARSPLGVSSPESSAVFGAEILFSGVLKKLCHGLAPWINWVLICLLKSQAPSGGRGINSLPSDLIALFQHS